MHALIKRRLFAGIFVLCMPLLSALEISIEAPDLSIQKNQQGKSLQTVGVNESFRFQVVVSGGDDQRSDVVIPGLQNFSVLGKGQSTSIVVENNRYVSEATYSYELQPLQKGIFTLGPARVSQRGTTASSKALEIQVLDTAPQTRTAPAHGQQYQTNAQQHAAPELFCQLEAFKKEVVIGEPMEIALKIYTRGQILQIGMEPAFKGFLVKEIKQVHHSRAQVKGKEYNLLTKRYVLWPLQQGEKELDPVTVVFTYQQQAEKKQKRGSFFDDDFFAGFFNQARVLKGQAQSNPIPLSVKTVPQGRCDGVGLFTNYTASLNKQETMSNEPLMLRLELEGKGHLEQIADPLLKLPAHFKFYKSKSEIQEDLTNSYQGGKKIFEFVVQPTKAGSFEIPEQQFTFFNYELRTFQVLKTMPLSITVLPSQEGESVSSDQGSTRGFDVQKKEQQVLSSKQDINFIEEERLTDHRQRAIPAWLFVLFLFIPGLFFGRKLLNRFDRLYSLPWVAKRSQSKMVAKAGGELKLLIDQNKVQELYRAFIKFMSVRFKAPETMVTEEWIVKTLVAHQWPYDRVNEFVDFLHECASFHFVAQRENTHDLQKITKKANYWLLLLNK